MKVTTSIRSPLLSLLLATTSSYLFSNCFVSCFTASLIQRHHRLSSKSSRNKTPTSLFWIVHHPPRRRHPSQPQPPHLQRDRTTYESLVILYDAKVGVFYGTSTGNTESVAYQIVEGFGEDVAQGPFVIDDIHGSVQSKFAEYDALIVGTPTWNTGADTERSGTGWDELYYGEMQDLTIAGKKVAVFGLGDQVSYKENYADATGELHDVFQKLGCQMMGYTSQAGYKHKQSKAVRGDKFCGLLCDNVNQEDLTEERVSKWVEQLKKEGFLDGKTSTAHAVTPSAPATPVAAAKTAPPTSVSESSSSVLDIQAKLAELEKENEMLRKILSEKSTIPSSSPPGAKTFSPYLNPKTGITMWVSADGRTCYYTSGGP